MSALSIVTADGPFIDSGNTAWVLAAAALVLFMTPGLAFFYGGMVRSKSVLNMLMMSMLTIGIVTPLWVLFGFSLSFGPGQVTFPGGSQTGCISVTVVNGDKVPMVPGFGQQPRFIVTIQPAGAHFNPPAAITLDVSASVLECASAGPYIVCTGRGMAVIPISGGTRPSVPAALATAVRCALAEVRRAVH